MKLKGIFDRLSLYTLSVFYFVAGVNHFINPEFYLALIPPYLPDYVLINVLSGVIEIGLAIAILLPRTRKVAAYLIIAMLIAFIPAHIYFIQIGGCVQDGLCAPEWVGWVRLPSTFDLLGLECEGFLKLNSLLNQTETILRM